MYSPPKFQIFFLSICNTCEGHSDLVYFIFEYLRPGIKLVRIMLLLDFDGDLKF